MKYFFTDYYSRYINQNGFKLVSGSTGLGKTQGIEQLVKEKKTDRKFMYIANRVQLLHELAEKFKGTDFCVIQKRDAEIVASLKKDDLEKLFQNKYIREYIKNCKPNTTEKDIERKWSFVVKNLGNKNIENVDSRFSEIINTDARVVMNFFKDILKTAYTSKKNGKKIDKQAFDSLVNNEIVCKLFPYIDYKYNSKRKILLVTIQKAFYGFFDGQKTINIYKLHNSSTNSNVDKYDEKEDNGNRIIFLDEFDFLENDLLNLIANDLTMQYPFDFVKEFYEVMNRQKLPFEKYLQTQPSYRNTIEEIRNEVNTLSSEYEINYPTVNHFVCHDRDLKGNSIFQTRFTVTNKPIFLKEDNALRQNSFIITPDKETENSLAYVLFNVVNQQTANIIRLFKNVEFSEPQLYKELVNQCFKTSIFKDDLRKIKQYPFPRQVGDSTYDKFLYNGFSLHEIENLDYESDNDEVRLKYYAIFSTPENIIADLSKSNMVFGLSATAILPRLVKNFDTFWLQNELQHKYYHNSTETAEDIVIITEANLAKKNSRNNTISVAEADNCLLDKVCSAYIDSIYKENENELFANNKHKKIRVEHFFATLDWILANRQEQITTDTHLLFFSSFKQIKGLFEGIIDKTHTVPKIEIAPNEYQQLLTVEKSSQDTLFTYFEINYREQSFIVVFYDANEARKIYKEEESKQDYYKIFAKGKPVLLVTTYPSAGNGVNLQYEIQGKKKDFANVHLLDSPYYYFGGLDKNSFEEHDKIIKTNIYYLAKLVKNASVSKQQFQIYLGNIKTIENINPYYLQLKDGVLNQMAVFIQALGRIEREWSATENQCIRLSKQVHDVFEKFALGGEEYQVIREQVCKYFSYNLQQLLLHINTHAEEKRDKQADAKEETLAEHDDKCREEIKILLNDLALVRSGVHTGEKATKIREEWANLRKAVLKHDFCENYFYEEPRTRIKKVIKSKFHILTKYRCVYQTAFLEKGSLYINSKKEIVGKNIATFEEKEWDIDGIYSRIKHNSILRGYFELKEYQLRFNNSLVSNILTPYCYQAILAGAIGEESVKAVFADKKHKIAVSDEEIADTLFELIDLKVKGQAIYIDCKNYSEKTVTHFLLKEGDALYHKKLNEDFFKENALKKLAAIQKQHKENADECKLIFINVFGNVYRHKKYLDENYESVGHDFVRAKIIFIHGIFDNQSENNSEFCPDFQYFIHDLKQLL